MKKLYEIAAELGMRGEHLRQMLKEEGFVFDSVAEDVDPRMEKEISHRVKSKQSIWDKVKGLTRGRAKQSLYETASELGEANRGELEELIAREEAGQGDGLDAPVLAAQTEEEPAEPGLEFDSRFDASRMLESLPEEIGRAKAFSKEKELEPLTKPEKSRSESARQERTPAAARAEVEAEMESVPETQAAPPKPLEEPGQEMSVPKAAASAPQEETPFSADELLGSLLSDEEEEEQSEPLPEPGNEQLAPPALPIEELDESLPEPELEALEESVSASIPESPVESEPVSISASQPALQGSVTIDELLGGMDEPEAVAPAEAKTSGAPEAVADETKDLLDTESLLGLEFTEAEPKEEPVSQAEKKQMEGVGIEELLGLEREKPEPSGSAAGKHPFLERLRSNLGHALGVFLRPSEWNNIELIFASCMVLLTMSAGMYGVYHWYNYSRDGLDQVFFDRAELLRKAGRMQDAIDQYELILTYHPDSTRFGLSLLGMADAYFKQQRYREAIPCYEKGLHLVQQEQEKNANPETFPDFLVIPDARLNLTRCLLMTGQYETARDRLIDLAREYPGEEIGEESRLILGDLYAQWAKEEGKRERYRNAIAEYNLALNEYPSSSRRVEILGRLGSVYRSLYEAQPPDEKELALLEEAADEYTHAVEQALKEDRPAVEVARLRMAYADTLVEMSRISEAIGEYDRLLLQDLPLDLRVEILEKTARAHLADQNLAQAEKRAKQLIDHNPDDAGLALAYYILGDAEWERGRKNRDFTKMMKHYQKALDLDDNSGPEGANSQRAYMRMTNVIYLEQSDYEQAARKYRIIIDRYPQGPYTYRAKFYLAECLQKLEQLTEAADVYHQVVIDFERSKYIDPLLYQDAIFRRGDCLYQAGQWAEAVEAYRQALTTLGFPDAPMAIEARERLAQCHLNLKNYPLAEEILVNIIKKYPSYNKDGRISFQLAQLRETTFDYSGARQAYLDLLKTHPAPEVTNRAMDRLAEVYLSQAAGADPEENEALRLAAASILEEMRRQFPEERMTDLRIARIYRELGRDDQARKYLEWFLNRATAADPQVEAVVLLGEIEFKEGRTAEALGRLGLVDQLPEFPGDTAWRAQAEYRRAEILHKADRLAEAQSAYRNVLSDYSESPGAKEAEWKLKNVDWEMKISQS